MAVPSQPWLDSLTRLHNIYLFKVTPQLSINEAVDFLSQGKIFLRESPKPLILDFAQTTFIDSSGIGALVSLAKAAEQYHTKLLLWSVQPQIQFALSLTSLDRYLNIVPETDALLPLGSSPIENRLPMTHPSVRSKTKRIIDILGAIVGLAITGILFLPIALAIKLDSSGPVLFSQIRHGWMGRRFRIWKFRTMVRNAEALKSQVPNQIEGAFFKNDQDPRITRVGRFLRRTSLDELPQFWNVLLGDMSLIGTRPPTSDELDRYEIPNWQRLDVKPGMSGEWQINGRSRIHNFEDVVYLDLRYQENWNLAYDLRLLFKTFILLLKRDQGAL